MRDLILLGTLVAALPLVLRTPPIGILLWIWVTLFNPQREVYGFLHNAQINLVIAAVTIFAWAISRERKVASGNILIFCLIAFGIWTSVTTYYALHPDFSHDIWDRTIKTIVLSVAIITLITKKARIQAVVWMVVISLGYYAVKGGGFVLLTGGHQHVYGPANTMIEDNNSLGLALVMLLPLINYLRVTSKSRWLAVGCVIVMGFTLIAVIGTYSRGAFLALAASGVAYALRSRAGFIPLLLGGLLLISLPSIVPSQWFARMATIQSYNDDASFEGRLAAWRTSLNIAEKRPLIGGGFSAVNLDEVAVAFQSPGSLKAGKAAHSIYFEVLGDHGFVGLALYLLILAAAWLNTFTVLRLTRGRPDLDWANRLARTLQVSMIGFLIGGAALSMAYYDGFFILLALSAALAVTVRQPSEQSADGEPRFRWQKIGSDKSLASQTLTAPEAPPG